MLRRLNIGCGFMKRQGWLNVDLYDSCQPDMVLDLQEVPWPWVDNQFTEIYANHVFEHFDNDKWFDVFKECARVLMVSGTLTIGVPDASADQAITYRDHNIIFDPNSFHGVQKWMSGASAWAITEQETVPFQLVRYIRIPFKEYTWMKHFPPIFNFCARHLRNFVWGQEFVFQRVNIEADGKDDNLVYSPVYKNSQIGR